MSSNKNTPLRKQMNGAPTPKSNPLQMNGVSSIAGSVMRKKIYTDKLENNSSNNMLNTAFTNCMRTPNASTPRMKVKSTNLNACYTPSSLFRNTKTSSNRTPISSNTPGSITPFRSAKSIISSNSSNKAKKSINKNNAELCADTEISNLTVAVRVRPLNAQECSRANVTNVIRVNGRNELTVLAGIAADAAACVQHTFNYDHVFYSCDPHSKTYATQQAVFAETARPLIDRAFEGYNACLFAYGQTGSGKSYSMMGIEALEANDLAIQAPHAESGIIPRFCHELFHRIESLKGEIQAEIEVSYFEIYNEKIHDLLSVTNATLQQTNAEAAVPRQALKVREHPIWGPYVVDLSVHPVDSYEALRNWLAVGNSQRATAATGMNDKSSRSHSIFNIVLNLTDIPGTTPTTSDSESSGSYTSAKGTVSSTEEPVPRQTRRSKISLVDLAGSERISANGNNGDRIREGVCINKSLLTLGKVIAALADAKRAPNTNHNNNSTTNNQATGVATASYSQTGNSGTFVPYRESVLTWLLRESLGGNSKTVMLATISPASIHVDETLATLRYACQARTIVNRVKVNESPHDKIIRELRAEVDRLKSLRNDYERQKRISAASGTTNLAPRKIIIETAADETEVDALRQQLAERERELARAQKSWMERLQEAEHQRKNELQVLRRRGLALELSVDNKQACLVNLTADPILSGTLFYMLPQGKVEIGRNRSSDYCSQPDIVLDGPLVGYHHCTIENIGGKLYVLPEKSSEFETYLNGELVVGRQQMYHGDRLVIGGSHYFRISNPFCTKPKKSELVDFQLAHQEILQKQELKLRRELEEEKRAALMRIENERAENERNFKERLQQLELEQLKFDCNREILETERRALAVEKINNNDVNEINTILTPTYKSTLLEDIKRIMETPSEQSLHKTQLMVKEATQRCRQLGLKVEFHQSQHMDEFGMMRTVVLIWDREKQVKAEWPVARLGVWLDIVRDNEQLTAQNIFACVDINWMPLDDANSETLNDSLNSSRISLNLSAIMKDNHNAQKINKMNNNSSNSLIRKCFNKKKTPQDTAANEHNNSNSNSNSAKNLKNIMKKKLIYDDESDMSLLASSNNSSFSVANDLNHTVNSCSSQLNTFNYDDRQCWLQLATEYVRDMQRAAMRLKRLCEHRHMIRNDKENEKHACVIKPMELSVHEDVQQMENLLQKMNAYLEQQQTDKNVDNLSPNTKTPKSVRFLFD